MQIWMGAGAYSASLGFNPDGELRILGLQQINKEDTLQIRLRSGEDMIPMPPDLELRMGVYPSEAEIKFLSAH